MDEITPEQEKLYQKRYEEGFDLDDPKYSQWLKAKGLRASDNYNEKTSTDSVIGSSTTSVVSTCAPDSDRASLTVSSVSTSDVLSDLLAFPKPKVTKKKRKPGFIQKAVRITDDKLLQELEKEKEEKERRKEEKIAKQIERAKKKEQKKKEVAKKKEGRKKTKVTSKSKNKDKMTKTKKTVSVSDVDLSLEDIGICSDTEESEAEWSNLW